MPLASRVTRGSLAVAEDLASLSSRERLIFAQAVYEYGAGHSAWSEIAKLLSKHPLISRPKNFFTVQSCVSIYSYLMKDVEIERTDVAQGKKSPANLNLAQHYYRERLAELRNEIAVQEERFKILVTEIDDIRSGKWDAKILAELNGADALLETSSAQQPEDIQVPVEPELVERTATPIRSPSLAKSSDAQDGRVSTPVEVEDSDGEVPMDVSSPVRASSSTEPEASADDTAEQDIEENVEEENSVEKEPVEQPRSPQREISAEANTESHPTSPAPEARSPKPSRFRARSSQKTPSEGKENAIEEQKQDEDAVKAVQDMQDGQVAEVKDVTPHISLGEETPEQSVSREGEPQEAVSHESTPAPTGRRDAKREVSEVDGVASDSSRDKKRPREESEPVDDAESPATPSAMISGPKNSKERKRFQNVINMLHSQISTHRNGTIFHNPIKPSEAPDYRDIVKRPMDLKTIKNRVRDGKISTSSEYQRDIYLMFANSLMYNRPNSDIYVMAEEMMLDAEAHINSFRQTEVFNARTRV